MQTQHFSLKFYAAKHNIFMYLAYYLAKLRLSAKMHWFKRNTPTPKLLGREIYMKSY